MLLIWIYPSANRPHYIKSRGQDSGTYVRVGSTNRLADKTLLSELRRSVKNIGYDEELILELKAEAIDFRVVF